MPRSSGTYSPPSGQPVVTGTIADATVFNNLVDDLGDEITNSIARDGQSPATADLPMGNFKHTGVGNAGARNHYASAGQVQDGSLRSVGSISGTNTITGSLSPAITSYVTGRVVSFSPANNNTGAVTIALNGLSAKPIVKFATTPLVAGDLSVNAVAYLLDNGPSFQLLNPQHPVPDSEITTARVADDAITYAKMQNVSATSRVLGRITAGAGDTEELTPANLVSLITTADGAGSGLDADLLDGQSSAFYQNAGNLNAGTIPAARVPQTAVTQYQSALAIDDSQVNATTQAIGTSNTTLATTAFANPAHLNSANGYVKFPGGAILQWGRNTVSGSDTITFPLAFPTACRSVVIVNNNTDQIYVTAQSATTFSVTNGNGTINWLAAGY